MSGNDVEKIRDSTIVLLDIAHRIAGKEEEVLFADAIMKVNRRGKPEKRFFIITSEAFYIVSMAGMVIYNFFNPPSEEEAGYLHGYS